MSGLRRDDLHFIAATRLSHDVLVDECLRRGWTVTMPTEEHRAIASGPGVEAERTLHYAEQNLAAAACAWADARDTWQMVESADALRVAVQTYRDAVQEAVQR